MRKSGDGLKKISNNELAMKKKRKYCEEGKKKLMKPAYSIQSVYSLQISF